jgi:hypothetical protein
MQKGTMMTGIVDGVIQITHVFARVAKKVKVEGLITDKESAYINQVFAERLKEGNQYIEKVRELLSPKLGVSEEEKLQLLSQMYGVVKSYANQAKKFENGFARLSSQRSKRVTDTQEIARLFTSKDPKKNNTVKLKSIRS